MTFCLLPLHPAKEVAVILRTIPRLSCVWGSNELSICCFFPLHPCSQSGERARSISGVNGAFEETPFYMESLQKLKSVEVKNWKAKKKKVRMNLS